MGKRSVDKVILNLPVYVVDDDQSVRESLTFLLQEWDFTVHAFESGHAFLETVDLHQPGCVILDSRMPILRGQQVHQSLIEQHSPLSVIYLTGHGDVPMAVDALNSGAINFFQKPVKAQELINAIEKGNQASCQNVIQQQARQAYQQLTQRELGILRLLIEGKRNQNIADELCIAVRTVEVHRSSLLKKFAARTVAELAYVYGQFSAHQEY